MQSRESNRIVAALGVILEIDGKPHPAITADVSTGGMRVMLKLGLPPGTPLTVVVLEGQKKLRLPARVTSNAEAGLGLAFEDPTDELRDAWTRILKKLLRRDTVNQGQNLASAAGRLAWSYLPDGRLWSFFKKRPHFDKVTSLSADGLAFRSRQKPEEQARVLVFLVLVADGHKQRYHCQADVVRHTDDGFAVRFDAPRIEFRRALSRLRSTLALG